MALVVKIDSNIVGCRYVEEVSPGRLPSKPVWKPLEINSFTDFGGQLTTISRNPINPSRQRKKGVVSDLDASGGFSIDLTQDNLTDLLQGVMFADMRELPMIEASTAKPIAVSASGKQFRYQGNIPFSPNTLILLEGFRDPRTNGIKSIASISQGAGFIVNENLYSDETSTEGKVRIVGAEAPAGDFSITAGGGRFPELSSRGVRFTDLPIQVGEWVYIGGDYPTNQFSEKANNGFKRIREIRSSGISFDKYDTDMVTDAGTSKKIQLFFSRYIRNETGNLVKRRTYQLERTLGAPDTAKPNDLQSEYITGAVANEFTLNIPQAEKVTADVNFIATDAEQRTSAEGIKAGDRPVEKASAAFNTSSDSKRVRLSVVPKAGSAPAPLFTYVTDITVNVNNNVSPLKAIGVLGAFDTTAGTFEVSGSLTAYFATIEAVRAVRNNEDITLDIILAKENAGIVIDLPLMTLGNAQVTIEQDNPITLPIDFDAAAADKIDPEFNYTMMIAFFDYLPTVAAGDVGAL